MYLVIVRFASFLWAVLTCCEMIGLIEASSVVGSLDEVRTLAEKIAATHTPEEIKDIRCEDVDAHVSPEVAFKCCPPGGVIFTVLMTIADAVVLDLFTIVNMLLAFNFAFAGILTMIVT